MRTLVLNALILRKESKRVIHHGLTVYLLGRTAHTPRPVYLQIGYIDR